MCSKQFCFLFLILCSLVHRAVLEIARFGLSAGASCKCLCSTLNLHLNGFEKSDLALLIFFIQDQIALGIETRKLNLQIFFINKKVHIFVIMEAAAKVWPSSCHPQASTISGRACWVPYTLLWSTTLNLYSTHTMWIPFAALMIYMHTYITRIILSRYICLSHIQTWHTWDKQIYLVGKYLFKYLVGKYL